MSVSWQYNTWNWMINRIRITLTDWNWSFFNKWLLIVSAWKRAQALCRGRKSRMRGFTKERWCGIRSQEHVAGECGRALIKEPEKAWWVSALPGSSMSGILRSSGLRERKEPIYRWSGLQCLLSKACMYLMILLKGKNIRMLCQCLCTGCRSGQL